MVLTPNHKYLGGNEEIKNLLSIFNVLRTEVYYIPPRRYIKISEGTTVNASV